MDRVSATQKPQAQEIGLRPHLLVKNIAYYGYYTVIRASTQSGGHTRLFLPKSARAGVERCPLMDKNSERCVQASI
jgi:hypothetical protein